MIDLVRAAIGPLFEGVLRLIPDKNKRAEAEELFNGQILQALTSLVQGQLDINREQAKHKSVFVAGARPFLLWVCGVSFAWQFFLGPMCHWLLLIWAPETPAPPVLDIGPLMTLCLGMLGLGGLRTYEKRLGVAREVL